MTTRTSGALILTFALAAASATACSSSVAGEASGNAGSGASAKAPVGRTGPADDAGAMADLQASERWTDPRCRWLESGGYVIATVADEALFIAASQMGYIDLNETGRTYHHTRQAPIFKVTLTERGKAASATCGETSKSTSFGVPVSNRQFTSGTFLKQEPGGRTVYEVDFTWVPTPIGDQVLHVLTGHMAVQAGAYRAKVYMKKNRAFDAGTHGWSVDAIDDRSAQKVQ